LKLYARAWYRPTTAFKRLMLEAESLGRKVLFLNEADRRLKTLVGAIKNRTPLNEKDKKQYPKDLKALKKTFYGLLDADRGAEEEFMYQLKDLVRRCDVKMIKRVSVLKKYLKERGSESKATEDEKISNLESGTGEAIGFSFSYTASELST
jgi:CRP-like cAMP-binding protein